MKNSLQAHIFHFLVPSWWNYLRRIGRCGFFRRGMSLEVSFEVAPSILTDKNVSSQLLLPCHACLPVDMLPTMMVIDSNPLEH